MRTTPIALIVEDDLDSARLSAEAFSDNGCTVMIANSPQEAIRTFLSSPLIDLVYSDIHLGPDPGDNSGAPLSKFFKSERPDLPVVVYSTYFSEESALTQALGEFVDEHVDRKYSRGGGWDEDFNEQVQDAVGLARKHLAGRNQALENAFPDPLGSRSTSFRVVKEFVFDPNVTDASSAMLAENGYSLRMVTILLSEGLARPYAVWLLSSEGRSTAELYGNPSVHAAGFSEEEALSNLSDVITSHPDAESLVGPRNGLIETLLNAAV